MGLVVLRVVEVSLRLKAVDGWQSPILEVVDGWLELDVVEGRIVHEVVGGPDVIVLILLTTRHCCELQVLLVFSSIGTDKSNSTLVPMPLSTTALYVTR